MNTGQQPYWRTSLAIACAHSCTHCGALMRLQRPTAGRHRAQHRTKRSHPAPRAGCPRAGSPRTGPRGHWARPPARQRRVRRQGCLQGQVTAEGARAHRGTAWQAGIQQPSVAEFAHGTGVVSARTRRRPTLACATSASSSHSNSHPAPDRLTRSGRWLDTISNLQHARWAVSALLQRADLQAALPCHPPALWCVQAEP